MYAVISHDAQLITQIPLTFVGHFTASDLMTTVSVNFLVIIYALEVIEYWDNIQNDNPW